MPPTKKTRFFGEFLHFPFLFLREIYHMPFFFSKILTLPLQNSLFREEWNKKRAKIFQLKFHGSFPPSCGRDPLLWMTQVANSLPRWQLILLVPRRNREVGGFRKPSIRGGKLHRPRGWRFFQTQAFKWSRTNLSTFRKDPETQHFHLYTTFVTLWHAFFEYVIKDTL